MNWTHISSTQLSSRYRNARAMPSTGRSSCCRTTQKKRRGGFFNEEKLLWLTLLLLNRCLLHTYLLHGLPFFFKLLLLLLLLLLTTLMNSIAFVVFRLHTIFFFFLAFFCQTAPADVWWRVVVRWLSNRQKAQYFDGEKWANTATHSLRHTETRTDSSAEWWIIVTEWTNVKQSTPTSTLWANIIYFQHLIQKLLYWIIIP